MWKLTDKDFDQFAQKKVVGAIMHMPLSYFSSDIQSHNIDIMALNIGAKLP